jgi:hypothetical protein
MTMLSVPRKFAIRSGRRLAMRVGLVAPVLALGLAAGCRQERELEPAPIPSRDNPDARMEGEARRPLPQDTQWGPEAEMDPPLYDRPLPPETGPFVGAYNAVGRPRIVVFVNRTLEGAIVPTTEERLLHGRRHILETSGAADIRRAERLDAYRETGGYYRGSLAERHADRESSLTTTGPTRIEERSEVYLPPGKYDEIWAQRIDYDALENALAKAMSVRGEVQVVSSQMVRQRLSSEELAALQAGRPALLGDLAQRLGADVLVQVQARPTAQTAQGLDLRIVAEAINTAGGEAIGRANADFPGPMSAARLDAVSRYLARRLMDDMTGAWLVPAPATEPATQPAGPDSN